jgi:hypothetical protein
LEDEERQTEVNRGNKFLPGERVSALVHESMEEGGFWFDMILQESLNFDKEALWPGIDRHVKEMGIVGGMSPCTPDPISSSACCSELDVLHVIDPMFLHHAPERIKLV